MVNCDLYEEVFARVDLVGKVHHTALPLSGLECLNAWAVAHVVGPPVAGPPVAGPSVAGPWTSMKKVAVEGTHWNDSMARLQFREAL